MKYLIIMSGNAREKKIFKVTLQGSLVNLLLMLFKFFAGIFGHSSAMIADAIHSLSDFVTDFIVLAFVKVSSKPRDENHDYGHGKYETLASVIIGLFLLAVGIGILWSGAHSIYEVVQHGVVLPAPSVLALIAAVVSIVSKEILFRYTYRVGKELDSQVMKSNAWHHRSDALSSVGTAIGVGGAVILGSTWSILDPIAAVLVSVLIIKEALGMLKIGIDELLERSLPSDVESEIILIAKSIDGVIAISDLKTRRIGNYYAIDFRLKLDGKLQLVEATSISLQIERKLRRKYGVQTQIGIFLEAVS